MAGQESIAPDAAYLVRHDAGRNLHRFYDLHIEPNLFGECSLVRQWGRLGTYGRRRCDLYADEAQARAALQVFLKAKRGRGYEAVVAQSAPILLSI